MKKLIFIFFVIPLVMYDASAQAPDTLWTKTFDHSGEDGAWSVQQTDDDGYILTGFTDAFGGTGTGDVWLIKTDASGDTLWTKIFDNRECDVGKSVQQTSDGGYIVAGETRSFDPLYSVSDDTDIWLIKTDASGDTLWTKTFDHGGTDGTDGGNSVQQTSDGGYIITGYTHQYEDYSDVWLIKTDAWGDTLWTKTFGGIKHDNGYFGQQTSDGGYIFTGTIGAQGWGIFGAKIWLIKTDAYGDTVWTKTFDVNEGNEGGWGNCVQQTADDGYIIAGCAGAGWDPVNYTILLIKTDVSGDTLWTKSFDGLGFSVQQTSDNGYIVVGEISGNVLLIKTDTSGDTLWTKTFDGTGFSVQQTSDGGYIVAGEKSGDVLLIKTAPDLANNIKSAPILVTQYYLSQNHPNPFNPETVISYQLSVISDVELNIYNLLGQKVAVLVSDKKVAGSHQVEWNASKFSSGVYYYQLMAGKYREVKKMILLK